MNINGISYSNSVRNNSASFGRSDQKLLKTPVKKTADAIINGKSGKAEKIGLFTGIIGINTKAISDLKEKSTLKVPSINLDDYDTVTSDKHIQANIFVSKGITYASFADGSLRGWYNNKQQALKTLSDGTEKHWFENGNPKSEKLPDGTQKGWYENGQLKYERIGNVYKSWYENGQQESESCNDGTERGWYENGQQAIDKHQNGISRGWYDDGTLAIESSNGTVLKSWYADGKLRSETLEDGTFNKYYRNGILHRTVIPTKYISHFELGDLECWGNIIKEYYTNGQQFSERLLDESETYWLPNGQLAEKSVALAEMRKQVQEMHEQYKNSKEAIFDLNYGRKFVNWK